MPHGSPLFHLSSRICCCGRQVETACQLLHSINAGRSLNAQTLMLGMAGEDGAPAAGGARAGGPHVGGCRHGAARGPQDGGHHRGMGLINPELKCLSRVQQLSFTLLTAAAAAVVKAAFRCMRHESPVGRFDCPFC